MANVSMSYAEKTFLLHGVEVSNCGQVTMA